MLNATYREIIAMPEAHRRELFVLTASRLSTAATNVEKDFWVCWALDLLFNGMPADCPRLLFKGGTSLSKAFGLISRFSEDVDITVFREDLGLSIGADQLAPLSGKQRRRRLEEIKNACQSFIQGRLRAQLGTHIEQLGNPRVHLSLDEHDPDQQTLLLAYPSVTATPGAYVVPVVKIEAGARSALDPHVSAKIAPYVADDVPHMDLCVTGIVTVEAARTFWDKIVILHGLRHWHERRGALRGGGERISRHFFDLHQMSRSPQASRWLADHALARDCATHARLFFGSPDLGLDTAHPGTLSLCPGDTMRRALATDYTAMSGMVFGDVPRFDEVLDAITTIETTVNGAARAREGHDTAHAC